MSEQASPSPFRRDRNLSNRNFSKQSRHRKSRAAGSSTNLTTKLTNSNSKSATLNRSANPLCFPNNETENRFKQELCKMDHNSKSEEPLTPDPAFLDVRQKVLHFESLQAEEQISFKIDRLKSALVTCTSPKNFLKPSDHSTVEYQQPEIIYLKTNDSQTTLNKNVDEERFESTGKDFVDDDYNDKDHIGDGDIETLKAHESEDSEDIITYANITEKETMKTFSSIDCINNKAMQSETINNSNKDFPRNFRSRAKTELIGTKNNQLIGKFSFLYQPKDNEKPLEEPEEEEAELRNKSTKVILPILEELINTEETYVENLFNGIRNYGEIFKRRDLPLGLRGKKYVLLGNIEQIAEFHRFEFLPMLKRNRSDLQRLFGEFQDYIDQDCFYSYVIFTMNKQRSLKLCDVYKNYFKLIQTELDDKLGINSFLVQPIQRMARYPLLLQQFITTLFKNRDYIIKPIIESCCRLEKKMRTLLTVTNESEVINDIIDCNDFNVFYQGKFRKVNEFHVFDHTLKRSYRSQLFIFDKCIINTEIKGTNLVFHGRYPCEQFGILSKVKSITLFYQRRKQQECDFHADPNQIEAWLVLVQDMLNAFAAEERLKLQERYSREKDHMHNKAHSLSLFRDSNRFSADSGISIGNIWVMPKPELDSVESSGNRTTWYYNSNSIVDT